MNAEDALNKVHHFRTLCEQSIDTGEFSEAAYDEIIKGCDELRESATHYALWAEAIAKMIEDFEDLVDLCAGYPGYFGHALESGGLEASSKIYIESLNRKPTGLIVGLTDRVFRSGVKDSGINPALFQSVLAHPKANIGARECAEMALEP